TFRLFAQVFLVEVERGSAVQLIQDIRTGFGDEPFRAERVPAAQGTEADLQAAPVQAQRGDGAVFWNVVSKYQRPAQFRTIAGQPACQGNAFGQVFHQSGHQIAAGDFEPIRKHQDMGQFFFHACDRVADRARQVSCDRFTRLETVGRLVQVDLDAAELGVLETNCSDDQRVVGNPAAADFSGGGTANDLCGRIVPADRRRQVRLLQNRGSTEQQDQLGGCGEGPGGGGRPAKGLSPFSLFYVHGGPHVQTLPGRSGPGADAARRSRG